MDLIDDFIYKAHYIYGLEKHHDRGNKNPFYIEGPAVLSSGRLFKNIKHGESCLTQPFVFLGNNSVKESGETDKLYRNQFVASSPSISIVIGEYGYGKTELVHQLCTYMKKKHAEFTPLTLPINLALCRKSSKYELLNFSEVPDNKDFLLILFENIIQQSQFNINYIIDNILPYIFTGKILLILDGLDELVVDDVQHKNFFGGLVRLITHEYSSFRNLVPSMMNFKIVVCLRLEYFLAVDKPDTPEFINIINSENYLNKKIQVYFLTLKCFTDRRIKHYITNVLEEGNKVFEIIKQNSKLLDILRRPLLLHLFCKLAKTYRNTELEFSYLVNIENDCELFEIFTSQAINDSDLISEQTAIKSIDWDIDALSYKALTLYQSGFTELNLEDISDIISNNDKNTSIESNITEDLYKVHKFPFLIRTSKKHISFSHRSFFEYFTAKGVALHVFNGNTEPFDEIVLNVDTRRFLKFLINKKFNDNQAFDELTRKSFGLKNIDEWDKNYKFDFEELELLRSKLLLLMTEPKNITKEEKDKYVRRFLEVENSHIHPRYLIYSYESVAVYLREYMWNQEIREIGDKFSNILLKRLIFYMNELKNDKLLIYLKLPIQILVERILDIAQRLRYKWVINYVSSTKKENLLKLIDNKIINNRLKKIYLRIEYTVF